VLVENNEAGISARQTRQRSEQDLAVSQLGYLASPAHQAATAQVHTSINNNNKQNGKQRSSQFFSFFCVPYHISSLCLPVPFINENLFTIKKTTNRMVSKYHHNFFPLSVFQTIYLPFVCQVPARFFSAASFQNLASSLIM
jgi:hypothetical protein